MSRTPRTTAGRRFVAEWPDRVTGGPSEYTVGVALAIEDEMVAEARQQGRDRDHLPLIEAAELVLAARDSVGLEAMPVDLWAAIDTLRFGLKAVGRPWTGAAGPQVRGGG